MSSITEQIKDRINIVDLIKTYIDLKPAGSNYKALCPFQKEKTPSFMVSPSKQVFKCFGCGKGGDIFTFLQEYEGIEFKEALRILADKAGVVVPRFNPKESSKKSLLYDILSLSADFYHSFLLKSKDGDFARKYIKNRGIDDITRDVFKLGLSPNSWDSLYNFLKSKGFKDEDILDAGLIIKGDRGFYDRFRGRLMFPISDHYGRIIGFGGRILQDNKERAKYINTPQTIVYNKSFVLYGLDKAKEYIRKSNTAIIVEGYMDVISSYMSGVKNVVAASGTALSEHQLNLIGRFAKDIVFAFDMDSAGISATLRSYRIASTLGMNTKIVRIPQGKDPDELIKTDKKLWIDSVKRPEHFIDYYFTIVLKDLDINNIEEKKKARDSLMPVIISIKDPIERNHFLEKLAVILKVSKEDLIKYKPHSKDEYNLNANYKDLSARGALSKGVLGDKSNVYLKKVVDHILAILVHYPDMVPHNISLPKLLFKDKEFNNLYKEVCDVYNEGKLNKDTVNKWENSYKDKISELMMLADKDYSNLEVQEIERELDRLIKHLRSSILFLRRKKLIADLKIAEERGDDEMVKELTEKLNKLTLFRI